MNSDRYYDTPYHDEDAKEDAFASCVDDTETSTRDAIVAILGAVAKHVAGGTGLQLPHQIVMVTENAIDAAATHLDAIDELPAHHGFDGSIDEATTARTTAFLTALAAVVHAYQNDLVGIVEAHVDTADWDPQEATTQAWQPLSRTA